MSRDKELIDCAADLAKTFEERINGVSPPAGYVLLICDIGDPDKEQLMTAHMSNVEHDYLIYILEEHLEHLKREHNKPDDAVEH